MWKGALREGYACGKETYVYEKRHTKQTYANEKR